MSEAAVPGSEIAARGGLLRLRSDDRLASRAAGGDVAAFEAIYERYHQDLYRFCLAMVGSPPDAQDALQNTMVKALRALPGETREIKLKPWLYRIARNEAIEIIRRRHDHAELKPDQPVPDGDFAETAEARDRLRRLLDDLGELPDRQRGVLVMRELGGLGFDQIGEAFETSGSAARQTLYEARLSLRQMEAGREMDCDRVMRELSDADGRVYRRRDIRAHLRACADCRAFNDGIRRRKGELAAIAPLPLAASAGLLHGILGSGAGGAAGGGGLLGTLGAGTGKVVAGSALAKSAATVAVVAVVGVTAADRSGLIEVPLGSGGGSSRKAVDGTIGGGAAGNGGALKAHRVATEAPAEGDAAARGAAGAKSTAGGNPSTAGTGDSGHSQAAQHHHGNARQAEHSAEPGRPGELPAASEGGQQTAAAHKAPQANTTPGTPRGGAETAPPAPARPAPEPPRAKPEVAPSTPPAPVKPESQAPQGEPESAPQLPEGAAARPSER
jgi:RNA polymerase sigma factor (sigma-70 family)